MALSTVTVCDKHKICCLNGLPDVYHTVCAVHRDDTLIVKAIYHEGGEEPAYIDAQIVCRKLGCCPSDLVIVGWRDDIEDNFGGAPWVHDLLSKICIPAVTEEDFHIVNDFTDLF